MHELKITGETPEALYMNVVNTLAMFLRGPAQTTPAPEAAVLRTSDAAPSEPEVIPPVKAKRGKKAEAAPVTIEGNLNDELPASMSEAKTIEHEPAKELTLADDIRPRLMAIQAACTKRGWEMAKCVSYIQKLYGPFNISNAKELKEEHFQEFLEASEAYLSGEAPC